MRGAGKLRVLDLFSGVGGFSLGLERTSGFITAAFCEIEEYPRAILKKHWPEVLCYHDVRTLTAERLAADGIAVDVIAGGFPCQDISEAGKGVGLSGSRSGLWHEYRRLIAELRPKFFIVENTRRLRSRGLGDVLRSITTLGYNAIWDGIPASWVGAKHERDRLWLIGFLPDTSGEWLGECWRQQLAQAGHQRRCLHLRFNEPEPSRVADGVPRRMDRIRATGNAVVPQIPELIGRAILASIGSDASRPDTQEVR